MRISTLCVDDIVLLSHYLNAIQCMLKICDDFAFDYNLKFNTEKSVALQIGPHFYAKSEPVELAGKELQSVPSASVPNGSLQHIPNVQLTTLPILHKC